MLHDHTAGMAMPMESGEAGSASHVHQHADHAASPTPGSVAPMSTPHESMQGMTHPMTSDMPTASASPSPHSMTTTSSAPSAPAMTDMHMGAMQGGKAPADARSPDYSEGVGYSHMNLHMHGKREIGMLLFDRLEAFAGDNGHGQSWEVSGWYGRDENKLWLRSEGEVGQDGVDDGDVELFWHHAIASYWGSQLGMRHDLGEGPSRDWAAFGVEGLAPYWFALEATGYLGSSGRTAARLRASYDVLFTQRLVLEPELEFNFYGKDDPARRTGSGVSDAQLGLRLRYEVRRELAPYLGILWVRRFGKTADYARADGQHAFDQQVVAGIRIWF